MVLPVNLTGALSAPQNSYHGPFKSPAGAFYVTAVDNSDGTQIEVFKATDPTSSFSEQDAVNRPTVTNGADSYWSFQVNDKIHISIQEASTSFDVVYCRFDMSSDQDAWVDLGTSDFDIVVDSNPAGDDGPNASACSCAVRADGDIIVAYQGQAEKDMGTAYATIHYAISTNGGASFGSTGNAVANVTILGSAAHFTGPVIVPGVGDRMHIFFKQYTNSDGYQRCLRPNDTLETFPSSFDAAMASGTATIYPFGKGITIGDQVYCPYKGASSLIEEASLTSADTPTVSHSVVSGVAASFWYYGFANDGADKYLLYVDASTSDLWQDKDTGSGWGTDTEVLDAITGNHVSPNIYHRAGQQRLAYAYRDVSTFKYNEVALTRTISALSGADLGQQNSFHGPFEI